MLRVLIVTMSKPYPPTSGGAIRVHGIIEGLYQARHDVTMLCFYDGLSNIDHIRVKTAPPPERTTLSRLHDLFLTNKPDIAGRFYSDLFATRLRQILAETRYDVIQFEGIESVCYLPIAKKLQPNAKYIFDTFNAEYDLQRNIYQIDRRKITRWPAAFYSYIQVGRIARFEAEMCRMSDAVIAVSAEDAELLKPFRPDARIHVVSNGIWVDRYMEEEIFDFDGPTVFDGPRHIPQNNLVFTGKMDYRPNVDAMLWFTDVILPRIQAEIPDVTLSIVGQQPHPRLDHLKSMSNIRVTGFVDSVLPYLQKANVYVAPLRMGSGTRLKLLEAMAAGCTIVATSTASAGLSENIKETMVIADDPDEIAQAVINLLKSPERDTLRETVRQRVREQYDWSVLIPHLLAVYEEIGLDVTGG